MWYWQLLYYANIIFADSILEHKTKVTFSGFYWRVEAIHLADWPDKTDLRNGYLADSLCLCSKMVKKGSTKFIGTKTKSNKIIFTLN